MRSFFPPLPSITWILPGIIISYSLSHFLSHTLTTSLQPIKDKQLSGTGHRSTHISVVPLLCLLASSLTVGLDIAPYTKLISMYLIKWAALAVRPKRFVKMEEKKNWEWGGKTPCVVKGSNSHNCEGTHCAEQHAGLEISSMQHQAKPHRLVDIFWCL